MNRISIQVPESGTLSVTAESAGQLQPRTRGRVCGSTVLVDLPLCRLTDAMHRVDGGAAGPQHVGRVEHHGQRAGDVGARLAAGDHGDGLGARCQHVVDRRLLEPVQQLADRLVDLGDACDGLGAGNDAHLVGVVAGVVRLPQRVAAPPAPDILVDDRHEVDRLAQRLAQLDEERHVGRVQLDGGRRRGSGCSSAVIACSGFSSSASSLKSVSIGPKSFGCSRASARLSISANRSRHVSASHGLPGAAVSAVLLPSPMASST